ncbi:hypothetical protein [Streptomyces hiroshimensis]|uniref:Uncharacterized protein n=1 Tax=Streptomyces hiroshimensis TaxID=66424 RepID=A0ABQ2YFG7_9ACTN|nr:hypothetical protein [Streptomyces hiroshimensis]GGX82539.1 hypothetical protein GCM10010324_30200 [Streptomyces hiroshimensis]
MSSPTAQASNSTQATTAYHFIITIQTSGGVINTRGGVLDVPRGMTRAALLDLITKPLLAEFGPPLVVLFFDLQPNALPVGEGR